MARDAWGRPPEMAARPLDFRMAGVDRNSDTFRPLPPPASRVLIRCYTDSWTGYGQIGLWLGRALETLGVPVFYESIQRKEEFFPLDDFTRARMVENPPDAWCLQLAVPPTPLDPTRSTVVFTMWEATRIGPTAVSVLNQAEAVLVPCSWNAACFSAEGVSRPIRIVPLGVSAAEGYRSQGTVLSDPCRFGMAGRTAHGGGRKNFDAGVKAFLRAFPTETDVDLEVKIWPDCVIAPVSDPRVRIIRTPMRPAELAAWYHRLTALLVPTRGEGWGLHTLQAMACGKPIIAALWSGTADFVDRSCGYPLEYRMEPAGEHYRTPGGLWAVPTEASMVRALRWVYDHRSEAIEMGITAANRAQEFPWCRTAAGVLGVLREVGMLAKPHVPLGTLAPKG